MLIELISEERVAGNRETGNHFWRKGFLTQTRTSHEYFRNISGENIFGERGYNAEHRMNISEICLEKTFMEKGFFNSDQNIS